MNAPDPASISVIIPSFNDVGRVGDALSSIVNQTTPPGEIVVCDDGSEDGTEEFVREFAARQAGPVEIRCIRLSPSAGAAAARNAAIASARGQWIANCDSDDTWTPTKLERQIAFMRDWSGEKPLVLLGTCGYNMNDAKRVISTATVGPLSEEQFDRLRRRGVRILVIHSSALYSRADYEAVGGYTTEFGILDDTDFFRKMAELGVVMSMTEPLVYYRKRSGSVQVARFWEQFENALCITENERRRTQGLPPITTQEFAAKIAAEPLLVRFKHRKMMWGKFYYRAGAMNIVNGRRLQGAFQLTLASLLSPGRVRAGVRNVVRTRPSRKSRAAQTPG